MFDLFERVHLLLLETEISFEFDIGAAESIGDLKGDNCHFMIFQI